ncbi:MAG: alkane 1-monooxygenase [Candidatus Marinimicrobia bacterium]|nr:alkane 1-monooxygenase [Candidatus Neomarinimicrobiota bacterium]MBL7011178.1 alkane 1-monooxygenase [Candidatus Neomarinimicrobiota bacterium]MBL7031495.1 alkane 1-monooxygenase [Candidatus Neomarinimicrobiota bacterium]
MKKYLPYALTPLIVVSAIYFALKGQYWMWVFEIIFSFIIIFGDIFLGDDTSHPKFNSTKILNGLLYINFPLIFTVIAISVWMAGPFPLPEWGTSLMDARNGTTIIHLIGYVFVLGLLTASAGTNVGHELTHRKRNRFDMFMGNWFLALTWDCAFAIEHVYGHHKYVATSIDPATAKRGQNPYAFILRSSLLSHRNAWIIENRRLQRIGQNTVSIHNRMLIGYGRSGVLTAAAYMISGLPGVAVFLSIGVVGKIYLEGVNYMEHYGLIREKGAPILPKHSWNTNRRMSSFLLYNLTRHSAHHEDASVKYWELKAYPNAPKMPGGYLSCVYLVLFAPWIYHRIMAPILKDWDLNYANDTEREMARIQNNHSGISTLMA